MMVQTFSYFLSLADEDGVIWKRLLDHFLPKIDMVEVATPLTKVVGRDQKSLDWQWLPPDRLKPFLRDQFTSHWKYGAEQQTETTFLRFAVAPQTEAFVRSVFGVQGWAASNELPEDLAFYRGGENVLWTIGHEAYVFSLLTETEADRLLDASVEIHSRQAKAAHKLPTKRTGIR